MKMNIIRNKMGKKAVAALMAVMIMSAPVTSVSFAAEGEAGEPAVPQTTVEQVAPEKPEATSHKDNGKIEEYNKKVDAYNESARQHNESVDRNYEAAVEETIRMNEKIDQHNAAEQQRVKDAEERNAKAQKAADEANQKIDEENAAEKDRVDQVNKEEAEKVKASQEARSAAEAQNKEIEEHNAKVDKYNADMEQYEKDLAQYNTDLAYEQLIQSRYGYSVKEYNDWIERDYNTPARESVEKNASAKTVEAKDTYTVAEATEKSGVNVNVHIEHVFEGTNVSYIEDFEIDGNDVISINSIAALGNATVPGNASLYYNTDEAHSMGYWVPYVEFQYNARYVKSTWNCGSSYEVSYKDGKNHKYDSEDIIAIYTYIWVPMKTYKTFNIPVAPTMPENPGEVRDLVDVPELYDPKYETYEEKQHVTAELEVIDEAVLLDYMESPVKMAYIALMDYMELFDAPEVAEKASPAAANAAIANDAMSLAAADKEVVSESAVPMTIRDGETPQASTGAWALINLLCALATAMLSLIMMIGYFRADRNRKGILRFASLIPAIGAIAAFLLTENMANPMILTDEWTSMMIIILAVQTGVALLVGKKASDDEEELVNA